jgi:hypothetical protein
VLVVASSCGSDNDSPTAVRLDAETRAATVEAGSTVELTTGEVNSSIGDAWQLANVTPAGAVVIAHERYVGGDCRDDGAG